MQDEKVSGTEDIRNCHGDNHNVMLLSETKGTISRVKKNQRDVHLILSIHSAVQKFPDEGNKN